MTAKIGITIQARRGTHAQLASFTGAQGELVVDNTYQREVICDGATLGGWPAGRAQFKALNNSSAYTVLSADVIVAFTALTTAVSHTITLPAANAYPTGQELRIQDGTTLCGSTNPIVVNPSGSDTINSTTTISIALASDGRTFITNGSTGWICYST